MFRVVKYNTSWCGMCKALEKKFEQTDIHCEVINKSCDKDSVAAECAALNVKGLPTVILYKYDKEIKRWHGIFDPKEINNIIDNN